MDNLTPDTPDLLEAMRGKSLIVVFVGKPLRWETTASLKATALEEILHDQPG